MFGRNLNLFEIFGFKVQVNLTWAFLALLIAFSLAVGFFPELYRGLPATTYWWMALAGVIGLFFSIVLHELAHSLVARRFGTEMKGITLFMFGGVAEMEAEPGHPKAEFLMAIAGPIASVVLALAFYAIGIVGQGVGAGAPFLGVFYYLGLLNIVLAVFNLVPAFPLDGGRALRAALWHWTGDLRRATQLAARIGGGFGWVLMGLGIVRALYGDLIGGMWWFLIGMFVRAAAQGSFYQLEVRRILQGEKVRRFMTAQPMTVPPEITVTELVEDYVYKHYHDMLPVTEDERLLGSVGTREIKQVPRERWGSVTVQDILTPISEETAIDAEADATEALSRMQRSDNSRLMVTRAGRLVGVISLKDMMKLLALKMDLGETPRSRAGGEDGMAGGEAAGVPRR